MDLRSLKTRGRNMLLTLMFVPIGLGLAGFDGDPRNPTDGELETAIERRLAMDSRLDASRIGVSVKNGHATLTGTVETIGRKKNAARVSSSVYGVRSVLNELHVSPSVTDDQKITHAVKHDLLVADLLLDHQITVRVNDGVVFLEGAVRDRKQRRLAGHIAEQVDGVVDVNNLLKVTDKGRTDEAIKEDIIRYLLYSPLADNEHIAVKVNDGVVTLEGEIDHLAYRDALSIDIGNILGVEEVKTGKLIPKGLAAASPAKGRS